MKNVITQFVNRDEVNSIVSKSANPEYDHQAICRYCGTFYEFEDQDIMMIDGNPYPFFFCDECGNKVRLNKKYRDCYMGEWIASNNKKKGIKLKDHPYKRVVTKEEKEERKRKRKELGIKPKTLPHSKKKKKEKIKINYKSEHNQQKAKEKKEAYIKAKFGNVNKD